MSAKTFFWPATAQILSLPPEQVHVYCWDLDTPPTALDWEILSEEEAGRARRFVFPVDRDRFVRAHAIMRRVLGACYGISPDAISFRKGAYGKPQMETEADSIQFNLTHSAGIAALAVTRSYPLGIDVEVMRPMETDIAEHHFSARELLTLKDLPPQEWLTGFYRCWTGKEALLKGEGLGLNLPLDAFDVEVHPQRAPALLAWRAPARFAGGWRMFALHPLDNTLGTLAVEDPAGACTDANIQYFSLTI